MKENLLNRLEKNLVASLQLETLHNQLLEIHSLIKELYQLDQLQEAKSMVGLVVKILQGLDTIMINNLEAIAMTHTPRLRALQLNQHKKKKKLIKNKKLNRHQVIQVTLMQVMILKNKRKSRKKRLKQIRLKKKNKH